MTTIRKLEKMPYAQAHVEINENGAFLFSYNTLAAAVSADGWLSVYCLCSQTTRRHVSAFLAEYAQESYATDNQLFTDGMRMSLLTGELEPEG